MGQSKKTPWPTKKAMDQIYDLKLWGGESHDFFSGTGSHDPEIINPYLKAVIAFLKAHNSALVVCDLGCGDFNVGKHLIGCAKKYIAIDIVEKLIIRNKSRFQEKNLEFFCLDISKDTIPAGDCIIIRQVLQHLSNAEILNIVTKISTYKYIILTEHLPKGQFTPNKDIISGQGIRLKQQSGVDVLEDPFNLKIKTKKTLDECFLKNDKGRIVTVLYELF